jgi:ABC-type lipoprotein release transport system permease subunit
LPGLVFGLVAALALTWLMVSLPYGGRAADRWTLVAVLLALGGEAFLASHVPACPATKLDPMIALRYE